MAASTSVDDYLAALPPDRRSAMEELRQTIRAAGPEAIETIAYDMPAFRTLGGRFLVSYGAYKAHYSLFPASGAVIEALGDELKPYLTGKGTIRFRANTRHPARPRDEDRDRPPRGAGGAQRGLRPARSARLTVPTHDETSDRGPSWARRGRRRRVSRLRHRRLREPAFRSTAVPPAFRYAPRPSTEEWSRAASVVAVRAVSACRARCEPLRTPDAGSGRLLPGRGILGPQDPAARRNGRCRAGSGDRRRRDHGTDPGRQAGVAPRRRGIPRCWRRGRVLRGDPRIAGEGRRRGRGTGGVARGTDPAGAARSARRPVRRGFEPYQPRERVRVLPHRQRP